MANDRRNRSNSSARKQVKQQSGLNIFVTPGSKAKKGIKKAAKDSSSSRSKKSNGRKK